MLPLPQTLLRSTVIWGFFQNSMKSYLASGTTNHQPLIEGIPASEAASKAKSGELRHCHPEQPTYTSIQWGWMVPTNKGSWFRESRLTIRVLSRRLEIVQWDVENCRNFAPLGSHKGPINPLDQETKSRLICEKYSSNWGWEKQSTKKIKNTLLGKFWVSKCSFFKVLECPRLFQASDNFSTV